MLNKVLLAGKFKGVIETKTVSGFTISTFAVAIPKKNKDGSWQEEPQLFTIETYNQLADKIKEIQIDELIIVEGALKIETWENLKGKPMSKLKITANKIEQISLENLYDV